MEVEVPTLHDQLTGTLNRREFEESATAITRLQRKLTKKFFLNDNDEVLITFSPGVTQMRPDDSQASIIDRADQAMCRAKQTEKTESSKRLFEAPPQLQQPTSFTRQSISPGIHK